MEAYLSTMEAHLALFIILKYDTSRSISSCSNSSSSSSSSSSIVGVENV